MVEFTFKVFTTCTTFSHMEDQEELALKLAEYKSEHAALDEMIERALHSGQPVNLFHMQQLKKKSCG